MTIVEVKSREEALAVALIRNECRKYLTGNRRAISASEQLSFYSNIPARFSLYMVRVMGIPCGYAVIRGTDDGDCLTGCLIDSFRGRGWGRVMFSRLVEMADKPILNVLKTNKRAVNLYLSLGFKVYRKTAKLLYMRYDKNTTT